MTQLRLRKDDLHWREVDEEIVALEARGATYLAANRSGRLLWRMLERGATSGELAAALVDAYGIDPVAATADADRFVEQVREAGLLAV
jgi:hypothetical protein